MGLSHYLWYQSVVIKVFDVQHFLFDFHILVSCLVYVSHQILILQIQPEVFFVLV
jgi:hypothetical protein